MVNRTVRADNNLFSISVMNYAIDAEKRPQEHAIAFF
jgi:hypothetical protein